MKLAESKRFFTYNLLFTSAGPLSTGDGGSDLFIMNALAPPPTGTGSINLIGTEILDPLVALNYTVVVEWGLFNGTIQQGGLPRVRVDICLVAINDQLGGTSSPRVMTQAEEDEWFLKGVNGQQRWMFNGQSITLIKRKKLIFNNKNITTFPSATTVEVKTGKVAKRLRGKKDYEQSINPANGAITQRDYLKGWNFYWIVLSNFAGVTSAAIARNPVTVQADRLMYFKDF